MFQLCCQIFFEKNGLFSKLKWANLAFFIFLKLATLHLVLGIQIVLFAQETLRGGHSLPRRICYFHQRSL